MSHDLLTVVTPTLGDSCGHLNRMMLDLRFHTKLPFTQLVSDDGTLDEPCRHRQRVVTEMNGGIYLENPGPVWGISYNFNYLLDQVRTPWAFLIEDGLRAQHGWLEAAVEAIARIGNKTWLGHPVGMMGFPAIESWQLAMAGALPTDLPWTAFVHRGECEPYSAFWGSARHANWNDGCWSMERLLPLLAPVCCSDTEDGWPVNGFDGFRDMVRAWAAGVEAPIPAKLLGVAPLQTWPESRVAACGWFPGAFALVNMHAWRTVGRFRDGCPFFEGHFGLRLAQRGYLSLCLPGPPFCHFGSMGFHIVNLRQARTPRHHEATDGDNAHDILFRDFGCNGPSHQHVYEKVVHGAFPLELQARINKELAEVELSIPKGWEQ